MNANSVSPLAFSFSKNDNPLSLSNKMTLYGQPNWSINPGLHGVINCRKNSHFIRLRLSLQRGLSLEQELLVW